MPAVQSNRKRMQDTKAQVAPMDGGCAPREPVTPASACGSAKKKLRVNSAGDAAITQERCADERNDGCLLQYDGCEGFATAGRLLLFAVLAACEAA
jgi:hypothetical protein